MRIRIRSADDIDRIGDILPQVKEIHITQRPSKKLIKRLEELAPNLERILVSPSIYKLLPRNLDTTLAIEVAMGKRGRPRKYSDEVIKEVLEKWKGGQAARAIAKNMNIPVRTVYHYISLERKKKRARRRA